MSIGDIIWRGCVVAMVGSLIAMQLIILQRSHGASASRPALGTEEIAVRIAVATAASVVLVMVFGLVIGLFDPNVDNEKIFPILSDGFKTSLGALIVMMSGIVKGRAGREP